MLCVAVVLTTASCKDDDETPIVPNYLATQTILVVQPHTPTLARALQQNRDDIKANIKTHGLGNTRLVVYQGQSNTSGTLTEYIYANGTVIEQTLKSYQDFPMLNKESMTTLLRDVQQLAHPYGGHYSLIIGCHGMGWVPYGTYYPNRRIAKFIGGDTSTTNMETADLATAITDAGMHTDYILFDDCYMACAEVAYELKDVTDYLLASPAEIMAYGMPYSDLFHFLTTTPPDFDNIMTAFYSFYSRYDMPYGTYSVIDCREIDRLAFLMKTINSRFTFDRAQEPLLQAYDGFSQNHASKHAFYDLGDYIEKLCTDADLRSQAYDLLQRLVPHKTHTAYYYSKFDGLDHFINTYSGITVSDPTTNTLFQPALQTTAWWQATH